MQARPHLSPFEIKIRIYAFELITVPPTSSLRCFFKSYFHYGIKIKKQRNVICALTNRQRTITLRCFFLILSPLWKKDKKATQCDSEKIHSLPLWPS